MGVTGCVPRPTRLSLVTLFSLFMSIKDRPLLWMVVRSQTYYPEHILAYGSGKARYALVTSSSSFSNRLIGGRERWRSKHHTETGSQVWGLESKFGRGPGLLNRSGMGWSCLCLGYKRGVCFGVPSGDTLVCESPFLCDGMIWLWSSTVVRTRR